MRIVKTLIGFAFVLAAGAAPSAAFADDVNNDVRYFNNGNGNCGYESCGPFGCQVIEQENCPNEIRGDG